jgi:hypothetical protein
MRSYRLYRVWLSPLLYVEPFTVKAMTVILRHKVRLARRPGFPRGTLLLLLILPSWIAAQQAPTPASAKPMAPLPTVQNLKIIPLAGAGEMNDLERRTMAPLVVEVLDQNDHPVEGAEVVFRFPLKGPGATFPNDRTSRMVRSDAQGEASALDWTANSEVGSFQVHVTASYGNQIGETNITMSNVTRITDAMRKQNEKKRHFWSSKWFTIGVIAAAAAIAVGVVLATRGSSSTKTTSPTVTITAGSPTLGGPN